MTEEMIERLRSAVRDWTADKSAPNLYALYDAVNRIRTVHRANAPYLVNKGSKRLWEELDDPLLEQTLVAVFRSLRADWEAIGMMEDACVDCEPEIVEELFDELLERRGFVGDELSMRKLAYKLCKYSVVPGQEFYRIFLFIQNFAFEHVDHKLLAKASELLLENVPAEAEIRAEIPARCVPYHNDGFYDGAFNAEAILRAFELYDGTSEMWYVVENFDCYLHLFEDTRRDWAALFPKGFAICLRELETAGKKKEAAELLRLSSPERRPSRPGLFTRLAAKLKRQIP